MSVGTFMLIKDERPWIGAHLENLLPHIDQAVFYDGNSQDGTPEIISRYPKATLRRGMDPKDLKDDYVALFNSALRELNTDFAAFIHPDMYVENPEAFRTMPDAQALSCRIISYAGEPGGQLYRIDGRGEAWKNIYRINPDLGHHYFGHYGAQNEDVYFSEITGDEHLHHGSDFKQYPYEVKDSGIIIHHFSDVRTYERRLSRMFRCLVNQGYSPEEAVRLAPTHPRVSLKDGMGFTFVKADYPRGWLECNERSLGVTNA
jgi:hypothetical protein